MECLLSTLMGQRRLTMDQVAEGAGIHRNVVSRYYHDRVQQYDRDVVARFLAYFNVGPEEFFRVVKRRAA